MKAMILRLAMRSTVVISKLLPTADPIDGNNVRRRIAEIFKTAFIRPIPIDLSEPALWNCITN